MNKSGLVRRMATRLDQLSTKDIDLAVNAILESITIALETGDRVEIRGFGSFSNHYRRSRIVRNPKTGEHGIQKTGKFVPYFKPGKDLKHRVNYVDPHRIVNARFRES